MFSLFYPLLRPILFLMDAEKSHELSLRWLAWIANSPFAWLIKQPMVKDPIEVAGILFPNKVGLAAGLDKNATCIKAFSLMGFGHIEVGTVTPRPQPGNPKPRLFRLVKSQALINRFGFNNLGVNQLIENVKKANFSGVLGINIGKNFDTPVEKANDDYIECLRQVYPYASYVTVNISSPNTENLRSLQFGEALESLLDAVKREQKRLAKKYQKQVPIFIKIAPDLNIEELSQVVSSFKKYQIDGVIATNTTFSRQGVESEAQANEKGGMSGLPLLKASNQLIRELHRLVDGDFPIIGVGGICSAEDAVSKQASGADLVQIYSGFIYQGPALISAIAKRLKGAQ